MNGIDHNTLVYVAKSFGLIYLMLLSVGVTIYAFWPSNRRRFNKEARLILTSEDKPCQ